MRLVTKLPDAVVLKAELGIDSSFIFKDKEYTYQALLGKVCFMTRRVYNEPAFKIMEGYKSIEQINAFLASGRFFHQHVDLGIREEGFVRSRRRFNLS